MKLRNLIFENAHLLGLTRTQAVELAKSIGRHDPTPGFKAVRKGPGSGPDARPYNVALLVLAVLAGGAQTQASKAAQALYHAQSDGTLVQVAHIVEPGEPAPTFAPIGMLFGDALMTLLGDPAAAAVVDRIEVARTNDTAIVFRTDGTRQGYAVERLDARTRFPGELQIVATLGGAALTVLAREIRS